MNSIQSLRFTWFYYGEPPFTTIQNATPEQVDFKNTRWTTIWHNISQMQGLRFLSVKLIVYGFGWESLTPNETLAVTEPINLVTIPESFRLTMPLIIDESSPWNNLQCRVISSIETQD